MKKILGFLSCVMALTALAELPLFSIVGDSPYAANTTFFYTVTNNAPYALSNIVVVYEPTGQTPLAFQEIFTGTNACSQPFNLNAGASCNLYYYLDPTKLVNGSAIGGPEICYNANHPIYCSVPNQSSQLNFVLAPPSLLVGSVEAVVSAPFFIQQYPSQSTWMTGPAPTGLSPSALGAYNAAACNDNMCINAGDIVNGSASILYPLLVQTTDDGGTWQYINLSSQTGAEFVTAACSPGSLGICLAAGNPPSGQSTPLLYQYTALTPSWTSVKSLPANGVLAAASCSDSLCALGGNNNAMTPSPLVFQSTDQGQTWNSALPSGIPTNTAINAMSCNGSSCVGLGQNYTGNTAFIVQTLNGGTTLPWTYIDLSGSIGSFISNNSAQLSCYGTICVAGGFDASGNSQLIQSNDSGTTWTEVTSVGPITGGGQIRTVSCSSVLCVAVGYDGTNDVAIFWQILLQQPGATWGVVPLTPPAHVGLVLVSCDASFCFASGADEITGTPYIYQTFDGGNSWSQANVTPPLTNLTTFYGAVAQ